MANEETIQTVFEVVDRMSKKVDSMSGKLDKYGDSAEDAGKKTNKADSALGKLGKTALKVGAAIGAMKLAKTAIELGELGAQAQFVEKNFDKFSKNAGKSVDSMMSDLRTATQGMVSDLELQQFAMQSMISGVSFDDMITAMQFVSRQAAATGANVSQKMQTVMTGFARGSAQFLDDVGIQVMGAEDVVGAAVEQMKEKMDLFADAAGTATGNITNAKAEIENVKAAIGEKLIPITRTWNRIILATLTGIETALAKLTEVQQLEKMSKQLKEQEERNNNIIAAEEAKKRLTEEQIKTYLSFLKEQSSLESKLATASGEDRAKIEDDLGSIWSRYKDIYNILGEIYEIEFETSGEISKGLMLIKEINKAKVDLSNNTNKNKENEEETLKFLKSQERAMKEIRARGTELAKQRFQAKQRSRKAAEEARIQQLEFTAFMREQARIRNEEVIEGIKNRELAEKEAMDRVIGSAQMFTSNMISLFSAISSARISDMQTSARAEIEQIKASRKSEKQKAAEIKKINDKLEEDKRKAAMVTYLAQVAAATGNVGVAISGAMAQQPGGAIARIAAGLSVGSAVAGALATVIGAKPRFFNGGEVPNNGRIGDSQLAMVRSGERVLTPAENRAYKVAQNKTTNNRNISVNTTVNVSGGNPEEVQFAVENAIGRAIEKADRNGGIDYSRMPNLQNTIRGI